MSGTRTIRILAADAPKGGLRKAADAFGGKSGHPHTIELLQGPAIKKRVLAGEGNADLIVIQLSEIEDLAGQGHVVPETAREIGKVTVGVAVRKGAREPDLRTAEGLVRSLLEADKVIYNTATSGQFVAGLLDRLGVSDKIREKTIVHQTGVAVMEELVADESGNAIAFGHVTEIVLHDALGTRLVGPLPAELGRQTPFGVGLLKSAADFDAAREMAEYLVSSEAKELFVGAGVL